MKKKVVIIGQGFTARLSIIRSVAEIGCEVTLIVLTHRRQSDGSLIEKMPIDAYSKYVNRTLFCETYNSDMLMDILLSQCVDSEQKPFVFPDNDFSAAVVGNHYDILKTHFYCPHIKGCQSTVEMWMDKVRQKKLARELGLNVASSAVIEVRDKQFVIPANIQYPCFAKALISKVGSKWSLKKCDSKEELQKHLERLPLLKAEWKDIDILVEDFKQIDTEYALVGFSDGETVVIPGIIEILKLAHGTHLGVAVQGKVYPVPEDKQSLMATFREFILRTGFVGVFDIDFYVSQSKLYFCELNLRFGGSGYAYTKLGVNLPVMMIKSFLGEGIDGMNKVIHSTATFFNERMAMDDWLNGYMSIKEYKRIRKESDIQFLYDEDDVDPQKMFEKELRKKQCRIAIKQLLRKVFK